MKAPKQPILIRFTDGRIERGYFDRLEPGVLKLSILRGPDVLIETALPLSALQAVHFLYDLGRGPLDTIRARPAVEPPHGKRLRVHLKTWSLQGVRTEVGDDGFFVVPSDPQSNSLRVFIPGAAPNLVETGDLPHVPSEEDSDAYDQVEGEQLLDFDVDVDLDVDVDESGTLENVFDVIEPSETPAVPLTAFDMRDKPGESMGARLPSMQDMKLPKNLAPAPQRAKLAPPSAPPPSVGTVPEYGDPFADSLIPAQDADVVFEAPVETGPIPAGPAPIDGATRPLPYIPSPAAAPIPSPAAAPIPSPAAVTPPPHLATPPPPVAGTPGAVGELPPLMPPEPLFGVPAVHTPNPLVPSVPPSLHSPFPILSRPPPPGSVDVPMPLGVRPLAPSEVEFMISFDAPRPTAPDSEPPRSLWADPWQLPPSPSTDLASQMLPFEMSGDVLPPVLPSVTPLNLAPFNPSRPPPSASSSSPPLVLPSDTPRPDTLQSHSSRPDGPQPGPTADLRPMIAEQMKQRAASTGVSAPNSESEDAPSSVPPSDRFADALRDYLDSDA